MKRALPVLLTLLLLVLFGVPVLAQAPDDSAAEPSDMREDEGVADRVVRVSFVEGDVSFQRGGAGEWAEAIDNLPLFAGDQIYAGAGGRVELQLGRGSYIRLSEKTVLTVTSLTDEGAQFELTEGIAFVRVENLVTAFKRFELDTPNAALLLQEDGLYRVNVRGDDDSEVIVRRGAADVSTLDGNFKVREGRRLLIDSSADGRLEVAYDTSKDDWDQWSASRDSTIDGLYLNSAPGDIIQYETTYSDFYGASDLSYYGSWYSDPSYGYCWRPRVAYGWAPYRQGQWVWTPRAGWTWISSEPWGWAPYHYGRWVFGSGGWAWIPGYGRGYSGPYYANRGAWRPYYRWRPALVSFIDIPSPRGHYVGWYPLRPGDRWHRPDWRGRDGDHSHLQFPTAGDRWRRPGQTGFPRPPHDGNGVTILPVDGFTRADRSRIRPIAPDKDLNGWIGHGARPGLPDIKPAPIAIAPLPRDDRRTRIAIPTEDLIRRSVVTRNRPIDSQLTAGPPRERRLIAPRSPATTPTMSEDWQVRREKNTHVDEQRSKEPVNGNPASGDNGGASTGKPNRSVHSDPRILPADRVTDGNSGEHKAKRGNDTAPAVGSMPAGPGKAQGDDSSNQRHKRTADPQGTAKDTAGRDGTGERQRRNADEKRERSSERPRYETPNQSPPPRNDQRDKPRETNNAAPKQEQPPPRSEPARTEQRQQKQERQAERDQRKKP